MGYTHYYYINPRGDQQQWNTALLAAARIVQESPVPLGDGYGEGDGPDFADDAIYLNGRADLVDEHGNSQDHETFVIPVLLRTVQPHAWDRDARLVFHFTKTAQKPYDVVVAACLATLQHLAPKTIKVSSDGRPSDWVAGVQLARSITGDATIGIPPEVLRLSQYTSEYRPQIRADTRAALLALA